MTISVVKIMLYVYIYVAMHIYKDIDDCKIKKKFNSGIKNKRNETACNSVGSKGQRIFFFVLFKLNIEMH